jgi:hypothetical protein
MTIVDWLNNNANLLLIVTNAILIAVTTRYVILTGRMVSEMRQAREAETEPELVPMLIPKGAWIVRLRIVNAGGGPAQNVEADIYLKPLSELGVRTWRHPTLTPGSHVDLMIPAQSEIRHYLNELAQRYDLLIIALRWKNVHGRSISRRYELNLKEQMKSYDDVPVLVPPEDIHVQLGKIQDELSKIAGVLRDEQSQRSLQQYLAQRKRSTLAPLLQQLRRGLQRTRRLE